jgi:hypothetical protein
MGPSVGWQPAPLQNILSITAGGTYTVDPSTSLVEINTTGSVTIVLPRAGNPAAGAQAQPELFVDNPIVIVDIGGHAAGSPVTIQPNPVGGDTIMGSSSLPISANFGGYNLLPTPSIPGWNAIPTFGPSISNINWINVRNLGAIGNGIADDTAAINSAIAAFNSATNGVLYFPAGNYLVTGALTAITANGIIQGDGPTNLLNQAFAHPGSKGSQVSCNVQNTTVFTINSQQATMRDMSVANIAAGTPASGAGVLVTHASDDGNTVNQYNMTVHGFWNCIDRSAGSTWVIDSCIVSAFANWGIRVRNVNNPDTGDWSIVSSDFYGVTNLGAAGLRLENSGGAKIVNCKWNAAQGVGVNPPLGIDVQGAGNTVDLQIANCSIENVANTGIQITGTAGNGWPNIAIVGLEIGFFSGGTPKAIIASNTTNLVIDDISVAFTGEAIDLTNVTDCCVTNVLNGYIPVSNLPAITPGNLDRTNYSTVFGDGRQGLYQGAFNVASMSTTSEGSSSWFLGNPNLPANYIAQVNYALIGGSNRYINGSVQTDLVTKLSGGGAWWLGFAANNDGGGTATSGLRVAPLVSGGPSLLQILSGNTGIVTGGWINFGGQLRVTADVTFTSTTTLANITGLAVALVAGRTYSFEVEISWTDAAAGGLQLAMAGSGGLTATNIIYDGYIIDSGANGIKGNGQVTALGSVVASATTTGTAGHARIAGTITVGVAGTLNVQAAQNTSNGTATVIKRGSFMIVHDMP